MKLQKLLPNPSKQWLYATVIFAFGLLAYSAVLIIGIPSKINQALLAPDSTFLFIASTALLYLAYRPPDWLGTLTSFSATLILFATQLSGLWRSVTSQEISGFYVMGGLLPMSDSQGYYHAALHLLQGETLTVVASWRPLSHGFLATLLGLTQQNLQVTIAILVFITAIACFFLAREVQRSQGTAAGILLLITVFFYYRPYMGTVSTENLGLALGAVGLASLWRGTVERQLKFCWLGIFLLTLALNVRAGAFFILPALILWGTWLFRGSSRFSWPFLMGGVSAVLLGFLINSLVFKAIGDPNTMENANFSYTFYGLMVGGKWDTVYTDYPELRNLSSIEQPPKIYSLAWEAFRANPFALLSGCLRAWKQFLLDDFIFSFVRSAKINILLQLFSIVAFINCYWQRKTPIGSLLIAASIGILLSIPFVPPWDAGLRTYAATIPLLALFPTLGLASIAQKMEWHELLKVPKYPEKPRVLAIFGIGLAFLVFLGPIFTKFVSHTPQFSEISCPAGMEVKYFRNSAGSSINLVDNLAVSRTNIPNVRLNDFVNGLTSYRREKNKDRKNKGKGPGIMTEAIGELLKLPSNRTLFDTIDLKNGKLLWAIADSNIIPKERGIVGACGKPTTNPAVKNPENWYLRSLFYVKSMQLVSR